MANIVNLDRVTKAYGTAGTLLADVSIGMSDTDRVGVVGLNGAGKSTLLNLMTKQIEPDSGRVTQRRDLRVLSLPQTLSWHGALTVRDVVIGSAWLPAEFEAEHEWAGDAGIRGVLNGLGMPYLGLDAAGRPDVRRGAAPGRAGRRCWSGRPTCWCWTSRPTTWTWPVSPGWPSTCWPGGARWPWSPTTAGSWTPSAP